MLINKPNTKKRRNKMKTKKLFKYPKEIYLFWAVELLLGIDLIGPALLIFFKDWGGLNQTQTQLLQSWFMLWIFILEIPTGVFGDVKGKKFSVILGYVLMSIGTIAYSIIPNIWLFLLAEFLFALGGAFISGSKEAWAYELTKKNKIENKYREIKIVNSNMHMLGMIIASILFAPVAQYLAIEQVFRVSLIFKIIALLILGLLIPSTENGKTKSLEPNYIETAKKGLKILKNSQKLRKLTLYISILASTSYFVIWLYQEALKQIGVPEDMYGIYRIILLVAEILMIRVGAYILKKSKRKNSIYVVSAIIVALGFIISSIIPNTLGIIALLILVGGLGLQIPNLFSKEINDEITDEQRATVLSLLGMFKNILLTICNPIVGYAVDSKGVFITLGILGVISLIAIFFKPKIKSK